MSVTIGAGLNAGWKRPLVTIRIGTVTISARVTVTLTVAAAYVPVTTMPED